MNEEYDWSYITENGGPSIDEVIAEANRNPELKTITIVKGDAVLECGVRSASEDRCEIDWLRFSHVEA